MSDTAAHPRTSNDGNISAGTGPAVSAAVASTTTSEGQTPAEAVTPGSSCTDLPDTVSYAHDDGSRAGSRTNLSVARSSMRGSVRSVRSVRRSSSADSFGNASTTRASRTASIANVSAGLPLDWAAAVEEAQAARDEEAEREPSIASSALHYVDRVGGADVELAFSKQPSFWILSLDNPLRRGCIWLLRRWWFSLIIVFTIVVNCVYLALNNPPDEPEYVFTGIFTFEMVVKCIALGFVLHK